MATFPISQCHLKMASRFEDVTDKDVTALKDAAENEHN